MLGGMCTDTPTTVDRMEIRLGMGMHVLSCTQKVTPTDVRRSDSCPLRVCPRNCASASVKKVHARILDVGVNGKGIMKRLEVGIEHDTYGQQGASGEGHANESVCDWKILLKALCVSGERYVRGSVGISIQEEVYTRLCVRFRWGLEAA